MTVASAAACCLRRRLSKQSMSVFDGANPNPITEVDEEQGKQNAQLALGAPEYNNSTQNYLDYYENLWQQAGYEPGAATQALSGMQDQQQQMMQITDQASLLHHQGIQWQPPPTSQWGPLALSPPTPKPPPSLPIM